MAQREDGAAGCQGDSPGPGGEVGQVGKGVEDLASIAKVRIEQGNVPNPGRRKAEPIDFADQICLPDQNTHVALIETQR
ncbi:hypothetical protein D3C78_1725580 [compost metagenome]